MLTEESRYFHFDAKTADELCDNLWGEHSWQYLFSENEGFEDMLDPYAYRDEISVFMNDLCLEVKSSKKKFKAITLEEVESKFDHLITSSKDEWRTVKEQIAALYREIERLEGVFASQNLIYKLMHRKEHKQKIAELKDKIQSLEQIIY